MSKDYPRGLRIDNLSLYPTYLWGTTDRQYLKDNTTIQNITSKDNTTIQNITSKDNTTIQKPKYIDVP